MSDFTEERAPCGVPGRCHWLGNLLGPYAQPPEAERLAAVRTARVDGRAWWLVLWEPLPTEAAASARPHCCYINTVIFYAADTDGRHLLAADRRSFQDHGQVEMALQHEDLVAFGRTAPALHVGERFIVTSARVVRAGDRWWARYRARRIHADDQRDRTLAERAETIAAVGLVSPALA